MNDNRGLRDERRGALPPVSLEEQREMGLLRANRYNSGESFVKGEIVPARQTLPVIQHQVDLQLPQHAHQVVEIRTSATDRAKGFSIEINQLSTIIALAIVAVLWWGFDMPLVSIGAVVVFVIAYAVVWSGAWFWHRLMSAEGVSLISVLLMWLYLFRQQDMNDKGRNR